MPHKFNAARRHKIPKARYGVKNWPEYEASLRRRGDLRIWIAGDVTDHWIVPGKCTPKGDPVYTDLAIETVLTLRLVFHQPLRPTEGFVSSILAFMGLDLPVPDHTTLSRRGGGLVRSRCVSPSKDSLDLVVDTTGLKIYGPGEWRQERFGERKTGKLRQSWRKLHLGIDPDNGNIVASDLTDKDVGDVTVLPDLLDQVDGRIDKFLADGAYVGDPTYQLFVQRPQSLPLPEVIVPPRGAGLGLAKTEDLLRQRNRHVRTIQDEGRMAWQKSSGYNRRALVEATMSRYKRIIGPGLRSRNPAAQKNEAMMSVDVLNHMIKLGKPVTERIR
ncbi:MAG: IS5 family transposase [Geminicoccaceae bacterium]